MTKNDFIKAVLEQLPEDLKLSQKSLNELLDVTFVVLSETIIKEGRFAYPSFGTFSIKERKARKGVNPKTKEKMDIAASKTVSFKSAPKLKEKLK